MIKVKPLEFAKEQSNHLVEAHDCDVFFASGYDADYTITDFTPDLVRVRIASEHVAKYDHYRTVADAIAFANRDHAKRVTDTHQELQQYLESNHD